MNHYPDFLPPDISSDEALFDAHRLYTDIEEFRRLRTPLFTPLGDPAPEEAEAQREAHRDFYMLGREAIAGAVMSWNYELTKKIVRITKQHAEEVARLEEERNQEEYYANHDKLTGLLNQRGLDERMEVSPPPQAVLFTDGTNFKKVNDVISHDRGDQVLKGVAQQLLGAVRQEDVVARDGGDELIIVLNNFGIQDPKELHATTLIVRNRIEERVADFLSWDENQDIRELGYDLAIGVAVWKAGMTYNQLKDAAEADMKEHKSSQHRALGQYRKSD